MFESARQVREKAEVIMNWLKTDDALKAQVKHDPESFLVTVGLPVSLVTDVQAQRPCSISCIITDCLLTF